MKLKRKTKLTTAIVLFFYVMGFISAINAVTTARTAQGAIAWSVALVSFPFVAVPAYWVFGRSKFEGFLEAYDERKAEIDSLIAEIRANLQDDVVRFEQPVPAFEALKNLSGNEFTGRNRVDLLIDGEATFDSILEGIASARDYIIFQFYMIHDDGLGRRMQQALIERARAGVRVFVLYDEVGSSGLPDSYLEALVSAGAEVSSFKPTQGWNNRFQLNFRNHRKIVVVDGRTGWVGGHNVGDEYLGLDPEFSPWRDTHVRIEGPAVLQLQAAAVGDWYWATRTLPTLTWRPTPSADSDVSVMIVPSAPTQRLETAGLMFVQALTAARERIWISAPYFVPDEAVMKSLELAALRGVDVRIIIPGKGDSALVSLAGYHFVDQLRGLGIRFYEWEPGFLHEKVAIIDDTTSTVGTANFDNRSFRLNFEITAVIRDEAFASTMQRMFENDFARSTPLDPETLDDKSFWWKFGVNVSRLFAPIL